MSSATFLPIPSLPRQAREDHYRSPEVVGLLDRIRRELDERDSVTSEDRYAEFSWFAREYPRIYRHHVDHAAFRLRAIRARYEEAFIHLRARVEDSREESHYTVEVGVDNAAIRSIYFDFEAYLTAVNCSLDALARVVGTAYEEQTPPSFNKLCGKMHLTGSAQIFRKAKRKWVQRMKDYRDCFVHYTPVDTLLMVVMREYANGWEIRCKLPTNPNSREILRFRYTRRTELLRSALSVWRELMALDRAVAAEIERAYTAGEYPKRVDNLFFIGARIHGVGADTGRS